jgi:hypothetical protein
MCRCVHGDLQRATSVEPLARTATGLDPSLGHEETTRMYSASLDFLVDRSALCIRQSHPDSCRPRLVIA